MSHNSYYKPGGVWANGDVPGAAFFTYLDQLLYKQLNGDAGGTWTPATAITIGGSGITMAGPLVVSGGADITIAGAGSTLETSSGGRIVLGDSDFPTLKAGHTGRTRNVVHDFGSNAVFSSMTYDWIDESYGQTAIGQYFVCAIPSVHNGATLDSVRVYFQASAAYLGNPAVATQVHGAIRRRTPTTDTTAQLIAATYQYYPAPVDGTAYYGGGAINTLTLTPDQNNTIDPSLYFYDLHIIGEDGANYKSGTRFMGFSVRYTNIADMRF